MNITWGIPDEPVFVQVSYVKQAGGNWLLTLAGTNKTAVITHAQLIDLLPDVSPRASVGCDRIWQTEAEALFGKCAVVA